MHPNSGLFSCGAACNFAIAMATTRCPKHNKLMKTPIKMVEDVPVDPNDSKATATQVQFSEHYVAWSSPFCIPYHPLFALWLVTVE